MKHRISFYLTYACIVLFGAFGLLLLLLGEKEPRESTLENRMLAGFPSFSAQSVGSGSFMSDLELYLSDGVPGRDRIMTGTAVLMNNVSLAHDDHAEEDVFDALGEFVEESDPADLFDGADDIPGLQAEPEQGAASEALSEQTSVPQDTALPPEASPAAEQPEQTDMPEGAPQTEPAAEQTPIKACSIQLKRADGTYHTSYTFSKENMQNAIDVLNAYRAVLPEDGHLFFTQSPYASLANSLSRGQCVGWESDVEQELAAHTDPGIEIISTIELLEESLLAGEDLYVHTDHHWKPRAACYVLQAMLERVGTQALDYDAYDYRHYYSFYGSTVTAHPELKATVSPDSIDVMVPILPVTGCTIAWDGTEKPCPFIKENTGTYLAYLDGTYGPWRRYETGVDTGRKCLVIGDSFQQPFVPYLAPYYEEIHCTNFRRANYGASHISWSVSDYIRRNGIDDIFIVVCTGDDINSEFMLKLMWEYL